MVCFGPLDLQTSAIGRHLAEFQTPLESCTRAAFVSLSLRLLSPKQIFHAPYHCHGSQIYWWHSPPQSWGSGAHSAGTQQLAGPRRQVSHPIGLNIDTISLLLRVPNLLGIRLFALLLGQNSVATNAMFDNRGTALLLAVRLVFVVR